MGINLGAGISNKLYLGNVPVTNNQYDAGFDSNGTVTSLFPQLKESDYIDIGTVTDEREELSLGGIAVSVPGTGANSRVFWAIAGKVLRVTITGIIPDGSYVGIGSDAATYHGKSNVSVFRIKLNRLIAYQSIITSLTPNIVKYRRKYMYEKCENAVNTDAIAKWIITGYSLGFIDGTRNVRYTITLDLSNNTDLDDGTVGASAKPFGSL